MKNQLLHIIILFLSVGSIFAQSKESLADSVLYITPVDEAFMIDKETKSLFKFRPNFNSLANIDNSKAFSIAFEQKVSPSFSLSPFVDIEHQSYNQEERTSVTIGGELRYYYKLKSLIKNKKQANNLSSNYFALTYRNNVKDGTFGGYHWNTSLSYGVQKRFLNFGYFDYKLSLTRQPQGAIALYSLSSSFNVGIGIGKKYNLKEEAKCPIFKCYTNRKSALKINLNNLSGINYYAGSSNNTWNLTLRPNIIYELKIANSPLSIENDFLPIINLSNIFFGEFLIDYTLSNKLGLKYYFRQKKRIKNGKAGNNLSGQYFFGRSHFFHGQYTSSIEITTEGDVIFTKTDIESIDVQFGYGIQKEVLENMYFDISIGYSQRVSENNPSIVRNRLQLISDIKVGLMF